MATRKAADDGFTGGALDRIPPIEVFRRLYTDRRTAQLVISRLGEERTFWFDRGRLVLAASNREAQLVGELLRTFGLADEAVLFSAFEQALADPGRGLARALRDSGAVAGYVADACVRALAEKVLYSTFVWSTGTFTVTPLAALPDVPAAFDQTNGTLLLEALRRVPADVKAGAKIDPRSRPVLSSDLLLRYQIVSATQEEANVLDSTDGVKTAAEITPDMRTLDRVQAIGLVRIVAPGRAVDRSDAQDGLAFLNVEVVGTPPSPRAAEVLEQQTKLVWNTYRRLDWSTLYEVLGLSATATDPELRRAVHERARLFHPDNAIRPTLGDARDALEGLFKRVMEAEEVFRSPTGRAEYDRRVGSGTMRSSVQYTQPAPEVQQQVAKANYQRARTLIEMEDFYPAYEMLRQAVEFDPDKPEYWMLLAKVQRKNPKWIKQSTETLRRATGRMPESAELWFALSEACLAERNEVERVKALKEVLKLDPTHRKAQSALAEIAATKPR